MRARRLLWIGAGLVAGRLVSRILVPSVIRPRRDIEVPELVPEKDKFPHDDFDSVLKERVDDEGLVDYATLQEDRDRFDRYIALLGAYSPQSHPDLFPSDSVKLAYWINAYNAFTMAGVLAHYPVQSVTKIRPAFAFFRAIKFIAGGRELALDNIEHGIVRPEFREPRVHFALNCASMSCPKLPRHAFHPAKLDAELADACKQFVAEDRNVLVNPDERTLTLSMVFKWYEGDFLDWLTREKALENPVITDYVKLCAHGEKLRFLKRGDYRIDYFPYDWTLNDRKIGRKRE